MFFIVLIGMAPEISVKIKIRINKIATQIIQINHTFNLLSFDAFATKFSISLAILLSKINFFLINKMHEIHHL